MHECNFYTAEINAKRATFSSVEAKGRGKIGQLLNKFWAVGKLSENMFVKNFLSNNAKIKA